MNSITQSRSGHLRPGGGSGSCGRGHGHGLRMRVGSSSIGGHGDKPPRIRIWHSHCPRCGQGRIQSRELHATIRKTPGRRRSTSGPTSPSTGFARRFSRPTRSNFMDMFPGKTAYAVKTNGEPMVLKALAEAGVTLFRRRFSPQEIADVRAVAPQAEMLYMHPVQGGSRIIRLALEDYGIRRDRHRPRGRDHQADARRQGARHRFPGTVTVFVRIQTKGSAAYELSRKKFGAGPAAAVELADKLGRARLPWWACASMSAAKIEDPDTYEPRAGLRRLGAQPHDAGALPRSMFGGGFPAEYGHDPNRKEARRCRRSGRSCRGCAVT